MVQILGNPSIVFYYDADCGICSALAIWATRNTTATLRSLQQSEAVLLEHGVPPGEVLSAAYAISGGSLLGGERAIVELLAGSTRWYARWVARAISLPHTNRIAGVIYGWVARNRSRISQLLGLAQCRL